MSMNMKALEGKVSKEYFSFLQASLIILLTLVVCFGAGYAIGQKFFWNNLDKKRLGEQLTYLQQKVNSEPKNLDNRVSLGYTYFLLDNNEKAIKEYNQVLEIDKNYYDAYYNLGLVYSEEERLDDAMEMFQKAIEISPRDYKGYLQKGIVYRKFKMYKEAVESLQKAKNLMPGRADIIYEIGAVAEAKGDKKEAIEIYKEALAYDPLFKDAAQALDRLQ